MRACEICGKGYLKGRQVSHSHIRTIKRSQPNLRSVRVQADARVVRMRVCTGCIRSGRVKKAA